LFRTILCVLPSQAWVAAKTGYPVAHMAYGIGPGLSLISRYTGTKTPGGIMMLDDTAYDNTRGNAEELAKECLYLCQSLGFEGLCCDFEQPVRRGLEAFVTECGGIFSNISIYVPGRYAQCHSMVKVYIPTAITSGSLSNRLENAVSIYGAGRLALEIERLSRDIMLPSENQFGTPLPCDKIRDILSGRGGASFYSNELCAHYFTERDNEGRTHFYIYDDAQSFKRKTDLALSMGIREGFLLYPDAAELGVF